MKNNNIFLMDEETGEEVEFEIIDAVEENGERYILVVPIDGDEEDEALILKDVSKNDKEAVYKLIDDDEEFAKVAAYFMEDNNDYDIDF